MNIIFDFDGTIADTYSMFIHTLLPLTGKYGVKKLSEKEIESLRDFSAREVIRKLGIPLWKLPFITKEVVQLIALQITQAQLVPGMGEVIQKLKNQGHTLGILTSNSEANVVQFLDTYKLRFFDFIFSSRTMFNKSRVMKQVMKNHALKLEETIYIGDEIRDIEAMKKIHVPIIAVTWGFNSERGLRKHEPDYLASKPHELNSIIKGLIR